MGVSDSVRSHGASGKVSRRALYGLGGGGLVLSAAVISLAFADRTKVTGNSAAERVASVCRLTDEAPRGAADAIAAAAGDPEPGVRRAVMNALGKFKRPEDRGVVEQGMRDGDGAVRGAAAATLGFYADEPAAGGLSHMLEHDPMPEARRGAAIGLARCRSSGSLPGLVRAMEADGDPGVRREAFGAVLATVKLRYADPPDPADRINWSRLVEAVRGLRPVKEALAGGGNSPGAR